MHSMSLNGGSEGQQDQTHPVWLLGIANSGEGHGGASETVKHLSNDKKRARKEAETMETDAWGWAGRLCCKVEENSPPEG